MLLNARLARRAVVSAIGTGAVAGAMFIAAAPSALADPAPQAFLRKNQARLEEILTFRPPDGGHHPFYRLYPSIQSGFGFTNQFGWRGAPIRREKGPDVVRIEASISFARMFASVVLPRPGGPKRRT